uniref:DDE Tnp4 domain-containing protein n=1 Tax=Chenopodium quinoa TaxID=63459 RepID=A0A803N7K7_CHEQI
MGAHFYRSGETTSRQFHAFLLAILKLHVVLLKKLTPIQEDCDDERWKYFKNCLGALDGTMILVNVPCEDRPKYRSRKGTLAMNVLGVCSPEMEFTYVLPGWEGSAHDGHILQDAISRPNGLKVPKGCYYLCDGGYTNGDGFLAPYRGHLYHLKEWNRGVIQPLTVEEYFNLRHAKARNVIERCFGLLKGRRGILRSPSWMDESSASGSGRGRNKRFWTTKEDRVLVSALLELAVDPHWRCDNGFRSGYMVRLEEVINNALPGCGLKASPHIDSRLKTLVAKFRTIFQMLNTS